MQKLVAMFPGLIGLGYSLILFLGGSHYSHRHEPALFFTSVFSLINVIFILMSKTHAKDLKSLAAFWGLFISVILAYFTDNSIIFLLAWIGSVLPLAYELNDGDPKRKFIFYVHHILSSILLLLGMTLLISATGSIRFSQMSQSLVNTTSMEIAVICLALSALIRQGLFPFHLWIKSCIDIDPYPIKISFCLSQLGLVLFYKLILPLLNGPLTMAIDFLAYLTIFGAFYLSNLSFIQSKVRMSLFYIMLSNLSIVITGLLLNEPMAKVGSIYQFMGLGLSVTGLLSIVYLIENSIGVMNTNIFYGLKEKNPHLGGLFLIFCLCCVALPFSMSFIGEDIIFHALIDQYPIVGGAILVTAALNGINVYRQFGYVFGGVWDDYLDNTIVLSRTQRWAFGLMAVTLFVFGLFPDFVLHRIVEFL